MANTSHTQKGSTLLTAVSRLLLLAVLPALLILSPAVSAAPQGQLRVALILENNAPDHGAADMLKNGLRDACAKAGARGDVIIADPDKTNQTEVFRKTAESYDLVIVAEGRLHEILRDNAGRYPKVMFGCIDTGVRNRNIMSVTFEDNQGAYLAGAMSALLLKPGQQLGWIGAETTPVMKNMLKGFVDGSQVSRPGVRTISRMTGFNKPLETADTLRDLAGRGCGVVVVAGGYGSRGAFNAAGSTDTLLVGLDQDQSSLAPGKVPFSIVKRFDRAIGDIIASAASGKFQAKNILVYDVANGGVDLVVSDAFRATKRLPANFDTRYAELKREIKAGHIRFQDLHNPTLCDCLD